MLIALCKYSQFILFRHREKMNLSATSVQEPSAKNISEPQLQLLGISKRYPSVIANDNVSMTVMPGEIHAVLGENGAGKSTLMKIIYGITKPDAGGNQFAGRRQKARHRHGVPAFFAVRNADRGAEHCAGDESKPGAACIAHP
jgi:ABC-type glutathione transport system ATPase component